MSGTCLYEKEDDALTLNEDPDVRIEKDGGEVYLILNIPEQIEKFACEVITTEMLGMPRIVEERYEAPDGTEIVFDTDICGRKRCGKTCPGPVADLRSGENKILVFR